MYTPRYDPSAPIRAYATYQNRGPNPPDHIRTLPDDVSSIFDSQLGQEPQKQEEGTPLDKDARFARANIWKRPGWYDLPEWLRTDMLSKSLEQEGGA
jgi:hypothetical protein